LRIGRGRAAAALALALALALAAPLAQAVHLNPRGHGQVLIFPYYTANAGYNTLLSLVNDSAQTKALKLRFHEGHNGRVVFSANLYLAPHDVWTGGVFAAADGRAALVTGDNSCAVPDLRNAPGLPELPDGRSYTPFSTADFSGARADGGPADAERTREGHVEVIEMGKLSGASAEAAAFTLSNGRLHPVACARLLDAWRPAGYWATNASTDVAAPGGGLYGNATIVDVAEGLVFTLPATALDGFSVRSQHSAPDSAHPDLADAVSDAASGAVTAQVSLGTRTVSATYPAARAIDAVSAVLATPYSAGESVWSHNSDALTEWIIAAPTKRFYVDPTLQNAGLGGAPFDARNGDQSGGRACQQYPGDYALSRYDRSTDTMLEFGAPAPQSALCYDTTIVAVGGPNLGTQSPVLGSRTQSVVGAFEEGTVSFGWDTATAPAQNGERFRGLPLIGWQLVNYFNGNVGAVMSNYSAVAPLRGDAVCTRNGADC
ncbi:hypothetical protein, partial [Tahibacter caeni]|uniref:hypothetical protein n=1 Tax=Tahibacter caeni TaxID=1453545 RepID=UPI0021486FE9